MRGWATCMLALALGGCATHAAERIELGRVVSRDSVVVIETGNNGVVYTLQGKNGKVLARGATLAQLKAFNPQIGRMMETGIAWAGD